MPAQSVDFLALEQLFEAASDLSPDDRERFLDEQCAGRDDLRQQIRKMFVADEHPDSFLSGSVIVDPTRSMSRDTELSLENSPRRIGPYKLLEQIGEGGFGVVFMAEQKVPVRRKVALKVIKPGMDSRAVVARFEAERQALAMMDHPNIARILDGGTTDQGTPYFAMDLVRGKAITAFCDSQKLSTRQRLNLFLPVLRAIEHAHQKGIIHRDIKPSNVMVTLHNDQSVPRVIDFGIAKALHCDLTNKTLFTGFAAMVGTPQYMSPEQASMSGLDVDTRSDVYSLGVLLYELLAGQPPFDVDSLREGGWEGMRQVICEREPAKPSALVSTLDGDTVEVIGKQRRTEPKKLTRLLKGELDWIVLKAIEKDRSRRYASVGEFADDLENYLHDRAVVASPPSLRYRLAKTVRRNRGWFSALAAIFVLLAVGFGVSAGLLGVAKNTQRRLVDRLIQDTVQADSSQIVTAVHAMRTLRSESLAELGTLDESHSLTATQRANVLIAAGQLDSSRDVSEHLLGNIGELEGNYAASLIETLRRNEVFDPAMLVVMANQAERDCDLLAKSRLAILGLHLGKPEIAEDMFGFGVDPIQRTTLLMVGRDWFGDNTELLNLPKDSENPEFRSGIIQLIGLPDAANVAQTVKDAWIPVLQKLHGDADDLLTRNSCEWLLARWGQSIQANLASEPKAGRDWFVNSIAMTMRRIDPSRFTMGSWNSHFKIEPWDAFHDETPRRVEITRPFWIADREVLGKAYIECAEDKRWTVSVFSKLQENKPASIQNWICAMHFCNWLSRREGLEECYFIDPDKNAAPTHGWRLKRDANGYRLPTEAEWELACRGETVTDQSWGQATDAKSFFVSEVGTHSHVCLPNPNGLFGMHGNLKEICEDRYGMYPIKHSLTKPSKNPAQVWVGDRVVTRGSDGTNKHFRSSSRDSIGMGDAVLGDGVGIRLVRNATPDGHGEILEDATDRERQIKRASHLNPEHNRGSHLAELALIDLERGNFHQSAEYFHQWLQVVKPYEDWASLRSQMLTHLSAHVGTIERLQALNPDDTHIPLCRARHAAFYGRWNEAARFVQPILRQRDSRRSRWKAWAADQEWHEMSLFLLLAGEKEAYEEYRSWMLQQLGDPIDARIDWTVLKASTLAPVSDPAEKKEILRIAYHCQKEWGDAGQYPPYSFAFFRAGKWDETIDSLTKRGFSIRERRTPSVVAMTKWHLGKQQEARAILGPSIRGREKTMNLPPKKWPGMFGWWDSTLSHRILLDEAIERLEIDLSEFERESEATESE